jgi:hypothetical protein
VGYGIGFASLIRLNWAFILGTCDCDPPGLGLRWLNSTIWGQLSTSVAMKA